MNLEECKKTFERAPKTPVWLGWWALKTLQETYSFSSSYGYDFKSVKKRGEERTKQILDLIPDLKTDTLELGCWDGVVSEFLQRAGKKTIAIDVRSEGFVAKGVEFKKMDAAHLEFKDNSFDLVFSYDGFEHFADPKLVLKEAIRVTRTGGYIYLLFGPLYMSPMGLHAYDLITVPYCQFLFTKETLQNFTEEMGLKPIIFEQVNKWTLEDFRKLWNMSDRLEKISYQEEQDLRFLGLIAYYSSCFKSKTDYFDNLIVSGIRILLKKI